MSGGGLKEQFEHALNGILERARKLRTVDGFQVEWARAAGVSPGLVSMLLTGKHRGVGPGTLDKLARGLEAVETRNAERGMRNEGAGTGERAA